MLMKPRILGMPSLKKVYLLALVQGTVRRFVSCYDAGYLLAMMR